MKITAIPHPGRAMQESCPLGYKFCQLSRKLPHCLSSMQIKTLSNKASRLRQRRKTAIKQKKIYTSARETGLTYNLDFPFTTLSKLFNKSHMKVKVQNLPVQAA